MNAWRGALLLICGLAAPVEAAERRTGLAFDVYGAGLHVLHIDMVLSADDDRYEVVADVASQGMTDFLLRWRARQRSVGALADGEVKPTEHTREGEWRFNRRSTRLAYGPNGAVEVTVEPPPDDDDRPPVPAAQRRDTLDLLSSLVQSSIAGDLDAACATSASVYDGRRRYDYVMVPDGEEVLKAHEFGIFSGAARRCRVEIEPIAGFREESETGLGFPTNLTVWLARDDASGFILPVRFEAKFETSDVIGHLTEVRPDP